MEYFLKFIRYFLILVYSLYFQNVCARNNTNFIIENKGQLKSSFSFNKKNIDFYYEEEALKIFVTKGELIFQLNKLETSKNILEFPLSREKNKLFQSKISSFTYQMKLVNSNTNLEWEISNPSAWFNNYYSQSCPNGIVNVKGYQRILLKNVYPNIDWEILFSGNHLKYNFIVHPGGNPKNICLAYNFADSLKLDYSELKIYTPLGIVKETAPYTYQSDLKVIKSNFIIKENEVRFDIADFDKTNNLIIDPGVTWSTYFGGSNEEYAESVKTDNNNNVVICGFTNSLDGIFNGGFQANMAGQFDNFISKYDVGGNLLWSTYFGGESLDQTLGCAIDQDDNIYLAFNTMSSTGISYNGFQNSLNSFSNLFLAKFNEAGARIWATYFGSGNEGIKGGVAVDNRNNVYLFGNSGSSGMGTVGTFQSVNLGSINGLLAKFDSSGSRIWCTYFGFDDTRIEGVCFDKSDNVYFSGTTTSPSIGHNGFKDTLSGVTDAFLAKFDSTGNRIWVTYYGGSENEVDNYCSSDTNSNVYLYGYTDSPDQISFNGFQNNFVGSGGVYDTYIVKLDSSCNREWATYFGGPQTEGVVDGTITIENHLVVCGVTRSDSGVAYLGYKNYRENDDAFLVEFDSNGNRIWSSYFGGPTYDEALACATDKLGNIYVAGITSSITGIGINGEKDTLSGSSDAFLTQFNCFPTSLNPIIVGETHPDIFNSYIYYIDTVGVLGYYWEVSNGQIISGLENDSVTIIWNQSGNSEITVHAMYVQGCYVSSTFNLTVNNIVNIGANDTQIFPNPFSESIKILAQSNYRIRIIDLLGRTIFTGMNEKEINTQEFNPGIYFVEVMDVSSAIKKVLKIEKL